MMHLILVIAVVFVFAASCLLTFGLCRAATRRDMLEARWREESAGFPARGSASGLLAACPSDGSHDFYLSMMLDVPVPRVPMLRARLQDSRRGAQRASDAQEAGRVVQVQRGHGQTPLVMAGRGTCGDGAAVPSA